MNNVVIGNLNLFANLKENEKLILINNLELKIDTSYLQGISRYVFNNNRYQLIFPICYTYSYIITYYKKYFSENNELILNSFNGLNNLINTYGNFDELKFIINNYKLLINEILTEKKNISTQTLNVIFPRKKTIFNII